MGSDMRSMVGDRQHLTAAPPDRGVMSLLSAPPGGAPPMKLPSAALMRHHGG
jgi:hypothetical protein